MVRWEVAILAIALGLLASELVSIWRRRRRRRRPASMIEMKDISPGSVLIGGVIGRALCDGFGSEALIEIRGMPW